MLCHAGRLMSQPSGTARRPILDTVTGAVGAYSLRLLRSGYAGAAVNIRRSSDSAAQDIGFSGGGFDTAAFSAFIGGGSGFVAKWYDQSGGGFDAVNVTAAQQPQLVLGAQGGRATLRFAAASLQRLISASSATIATADTAMAVAKRATATAYNAIFGINYAGGGTTGVAVFYAGASSQDWATNDIVSVGNGFSSLQAPRFVASTPAASTDGLSHIVETVLSGSTATLLVDGAAQTARASTPGAVPSQSAAVNIGVTSVADGAYMNGDVPEIIIWSSVVSAANRATVRASMKSYYGTP